MTYSPIVPLGGYAGWSFLDRTKEAQQAAFDNSTLIKTQVEYFQANIGVVQSAEQLIADRRLLQVALGAFGLDEDIGNKYFLQKILEDGTLREDSLANRLSDKRYFDLAQAFGFDLEPPRTTVSTFSEEITAAYKTKQFEIAIGEQDPTLRLALGLDTALAQIADRDTTDNGRWFTVMGQPPVREVFEKALGLPSSVGALDLDRQLSAFRDKAQTRFGDGEVSQFADPEKRAELVRLFLLRSQAEGSSAIANNLQGNAALAILQSIGQSSRT